jgi:hypothetical protein
VVSLQNSIPVPNEDELGGKMICTNGKVSDMPGREKERYDLTEEASQRDNEQSSAAARQAESDDMYQGSGLINTPSPDGDEAGENRVATSLSDE